MISSSWKTKFWARVASLAVVFGLFSSASFAATNDLHRRLVDKKSPITVSELESILEAHP